MINEQGEVSDRTFGVRGSSQCLLKRHLKNLCKSNGMVGVDLFTNLMRTLLRPARVRLILERDFDVSLPLIIDSDFFKFWYARTRKLKGT